MRVFTRWLAAGGEFVRHIQTLPLARAKAFYGGIDDQHHSIARSLRKLLTRAVLLALACASHPALALLAIVPDGPVTAIAQGDDGVTYLAGYFAGWVTQTGGGAALDRASGIVDRAFPFFDGKLLAAAPDGNGGWYVGGSFSAVGGLPRRNLAHIDSKGNVTGWNPGVAGAVSNLAVSGGIVYIGGGFNSVGGQARDYLAAVNADGTVSAWNPAPNGAVFAMVVDKDRVYVGGNFTSIAGGLRRHLAAVAMDGSLSDWNPGVSGGWGVRALAVRGNTLYAGGEFWMIGGQYATGLAAVRTDTAVAQVVWSPVLNDSSLFGIFSVHALAVVGDTVFIGGYFGLVDGQPRNGLAAIGVDGKLTAWNPNPTGSVFGGGISVLAASENSIYVAGGFSSVGGKARAGLAEIDLDGVATGWDPKPDNTVLTVAVSATKVFAGGNFQNMGRQVRNGLAALDSDGNLTPWNPEVSGGSVSALTVGGGVVYAGGTFDTVNGQQRNCVAAIGTDGVLSAWNPNVILLPPSMGVIESRGVNALARVADTIYIGGRFYSVGGQPRRSLAAVTVSGTLLPGNLDTDGVVYALSARGDIAYVGGAFTKVGGQAHRAVAAVDKSGALSAWDPDVSAVGWSFVNTIAVGGNTLYLGGQFDHVGGQPRKNLAAVNRDGTPTGWNPGADSSVAALAVSAGTVYAGYSVYLGFINSEFLYRYVLEAINFDGQRVAWNPNPNQVVNVLAACGNAVCVGGGFTSIANQVWPGSASFKFARLIPAPVATTITLTGSPASPTGYGVSVALTATLNPPSAGGTLTFKDSVTIVPGCQTVPINAATGAAVCNTAALGGGAHSLTAVYAGVGAYQPSTSAPYTHSVNVASQTITFGAVPVVVVGGIGWVGAEGGASGNQVVFSSLMPSICGVSDSMVQGLAPGTCTIAANQAGSVNFSAAAQVTQDILVQPLGGGDTRISGLVERMSVLATVGGGTWAFAPQGTGSLQSGGFIPLQGHPKSPPTPPPTGLQFPYGLFDFVALGGVPGSVLTVAITYPHPLRPNMQYWKYGATALDPTSHWYQYGNVSISGNTVTLTITDGGPGDGDHSANGTIVDPGGLVDPTPPSAIPSLDARSLWLLASLMLLAGMARLRSRQSS